MEYVGQPSQITVPNLSWPAWFLPAINQFSDRVAVIEAETGRELSFRDLHAQIHALALALRAQGIAKGSVVAMFATNSPEYIIAFQATLLAGATVTTANPQYTEDELVNQLSHAGATYLFTDEDLLEKAQPAASRSGIESVFLLQPHAIDEPGLAQSMGDLVAQFHGQLCDLPEFDPATTVAVMPYSSGTTGLPKGVMLSHTNILVNCLQINTQPEITNPSPRNIVLAVIPFFHIFGLTVNMNAGLGFGATLVTLRRFEPELFLSTIEKHRVNMAYVVPPIVLFLGSHPLVDEYDISTLKYLLSGAAPLSAEQVKPISEKINCAIYQGYGLTETSPVTHRVPDLSDRDGSGTVGVLLPGTEAKIVNMDGTEVDPGSETGELLIRGPQVMLGYFNDVEATALVIDDDGWFHTGDIACADEHGYFKIVDRLKELIKYKGFQVAPAELEGLLLTHQAVKDVAVVPFPDLRAGEIPEAVIVPAADNQVSADEIMSWVAARVAPFKQIRRVRFVETIPKSASGKILRRLLRASN